MNLNPHSSFKVHLADRPGLKFRRKLWKASVELIEFASVEDFYNCAMLAKWVSAKPGRLFSRRNNVLEVCDYNAHWNGSAQTVDGIWRLCSHPPHAGL